MELIIKPTQICNFACTFCSSTDIASSNKSVLDLEKIYTFLTRFPNTNSIIVNGGEPLILGPDYYFKILSYIEKKHLRTELSFTSNLWDFYKNPKKWVPLFTHPNVRVATSFQLGESRRISPTRVFTRELFIEISDLMLAEIGYRPDFISVTTEESAPYALDNVRLARDLLVECKLNYAMTSGRQGRPFPLSRIYKIYYDIWKAGLAPWEYYTKQLIARTQLASSFPCPRLRECDEVIRALNPDGDYYSCGSFSDEREEPIDWDTEMSSQKIMTPLRDNPELSSLKPECFSCEFFELCNGCRKTIRDIKKIDGVDEHCSNMKAQKMGLHEMGFTQ